MVHSLSGRLLLLQRSEGEGKLRIFCDLDIYPCSA